MIRSAAASCVAATFQFFYRGCFVGWRGLLVPTRTIVEEVIESNLRHLNIRIAGGESVAAEEPSGWNNK
jgi:hypothetical protein